MEAERELSFRLRQIDVGKLDPDEPLFVLRARDRLAASLVRIWAILAEDAGAPPEKVEDARNLADAMEAWPFKQIPGRPETRTFDADKAYDAAPDVPLSADRINEIVKYATGAQDPRDTP